MALQVGDTIIVYEKVTTLIMKGSQGVITKIDKKGFLYGTWGGEIINPSDARFIVIKKSKN